ncbi:hypothetical protein LCM23_06790 [Cytobacillus kochii]|uniref:DUF4376 domain-containing protein n=1 Tax=Cytobacillus kochii TaxID=859143 RepID=UPI001CD3B153|nr:hypothetical protein [Cytobacillus kochii]MCA1025794.1 hypothetical protein [Cytobacillus kochii]
MKVIYILVDENGVLQSFGYTRSMDSEIELEVEETHPLLSKEFTPRVFLYQDGQIVKSDVLELERAKSGKNSKLKKACEESILAGFSSANGHFYRTNRDDQTNMIGQKDILNSDESISTVQWKTEDAGYIAHTREEWLKVYNEAFMHKQKQLFKYDSLKSQVLSATTQEELDSINW